MPRLVSKYGPLHALAAGAVLSFAVFAKGPAAYWQQFLHGLGAAAPKPAVLMLMIASQVLLFGVLLLFLWVSTLFNRRPCPTAPVDYRRSFRLVLSSFVPVAVVALGLEWLSVTLLEKLGGIACAQQELVAWLKPGLYSPAVRTVLALTVLFEAPLLEEPLFRGVIFRGFLKGLPPWGAMAASGFLFALIHVNAGAFIPLWYLGVAFAWLYWRTGTILAPMLAHFLFNLANFAMLLVLPA